LCDELQRAPKKLRLDNEKKEELEPELAACVGEIKTAKSEGRDFSIDIHSKADLVKRFGVQRVVECVFSAIRESETALIDAPTTCDFVKVAPLIQRVVSESERLGKEVLAWSYKGAPVDFDGTTHPLLSCSTTSGMLSTFLSGHVRYSRRMTSKSPSAADNWNNDAVLRKAIENSVGNPRNSKEALSRNRLRVGCMQVRGCRYPTAFPVSVVLWILKREAALRPDGKLVRFIDPCAGWGDRLAGALIAGKDVVEHYFGVDPWVVSHDLCALVRRAITSDVRVEMRATGAQDEAEPWPDADLCFTSPPYAALECYDTESADTAEDNNRQAWRFCAHGKFASHFLEPMMRNCARATRKLNGRVIVNIGNTDRAGMGERLTDDVVSAARKAGLELVETFGMRLSVRAPRSSFQHGASTLRGEPFFVFGHPRQRQ
jgi:hypothetical protein